MPYLLAIAWCEESWSYRATIAACWDGDSSGKAELNITQDKNKHVGHIVQSMSHSYHVTIWILSATTSIMHWACTVSLLKCVWHAGPIGKWSASCGLWCAWASSWDSHTMWWLLQAVSSGCTATHHWCQIVATALAQQPTEEASHANTCWTCTRPESLCASIK